VRFGIWGAVFFSDNTQKQNRSLLFNFTAGFKVVSYFTTTHHHQHPPDLASCNLSLLFFWLLSQHDLIMLETPEDSIFDHKAKQIMRQQWLRAQMKTR
jgi:hypothetical protein